MRFGPVPLAEAEGAILAHSLRAGGKVWKKGLLLAPGDLAALAEAGLSEVTVARLEPGDVAEGPAAARLGEALLGADPAALGLRASRPENGRVNLYAEGHGILRLDRAAIEAMNGADPMITIATLREWARLGPGVMVATIKIIAYAVPEAALRRAEAAAPGALALQRPAHHRVTLIETALDGADPGPKGLRAIGKRLAELGVEGGAERVVVPHRIGPLAEAIAAARTSAILILTASATSDVEDVAPAALRAAGGELERFGMPVDPGNLLFLGRLGARPVIGLPGCARSTALNGADWMMDRVLCGVGMTAQDIAALGVGGLLKEIPSRPQPREG